MGQVIKVYSQAVVETNSKNGGVLVLFSSEPVQFSVLEYQQFPQCLIDEYQDNKQSR